MRRRHSSYSCLPALNDCSVRGFLTIADTTNPATGGFDQPDYIYPDQLLLNKEEERISERRQLKLDLF